MDRPKTLNTLDIGDFNESNALSQNVKVVFATEDLTMDVNDRLVRATVSAASITVTLPSVREAAFVGIYVVHLVDTSNAKTVTVADKGDDAGLTDITLDTDNDYVVLFSDGYVWRELASEKA